MPIPDPESFLRNVTFPNFELMVAKPNVYFWKTGGSLKLVEKIIYPWKRIFFLDDNLIQLMVVYSHPKGTIFHSYKQDHSAPRWDAWLN